MPFKPRESDNYKSKVVSHKSCIQNIEPEHGRVMLQQSRENSGLKNMENSEFFFKKYVIWRSTGTIVF